MTDTVQDSPGADWVSAREPHVRRAPSTPGSSLGRTPESRAGAPTARKPHALRDPSTRSGYRNNLNLVTKHEYLLRCDKLR
jgi:hypothetical protein